MIARALQSALDSKLSQRFKKLTKAERLDATAVALRKTCRFSPVGENGALPERVIRMGTGAPNSTKEFLDQGEAWRLDSKAEWVNPKVQDMQEFRFADSKKLLDIFLQLSLRQLSHTTGWCRSLLQNNGRVRYPTFACSRRC